MIEPNCDCHGEAMRWVNEPRRRAGGFWKCRVKHREAAKAWSRSHPEAVRKRKKDWAARNPERDLANRRAWDRANQPEIRYRKHHTTSEAMRVVYGEQRGACAACGTPSKFERLRVDHDHACCPGNYSCGRCIRGLLCHGCNVKDALAS